MAFRSLSKLFHRVQGGRVPVILQMRTVECSAACLAMILSFHGRRTTIHECRKHLEASRDGATALDIANAARDFGLDVKGYSAGLSALDQLTFPVIVHWEFNHFIVVERYTHKFVDIVDPAIGRRRISVSEFTTGFTGVVLTFSLGINFDTANSTADIRQLRNFLGLTFQRSRIASLLIQMVVISLIVQFLGLALPVFTQFLVDYVLQYYATDIMIVFGLGFGLVALAQMISTFIRGIALIYFRARLDTQMVLSFFEHLLTLPLPFFQQRTIGDLLIGISSNSSIREIFSSQLISIILDGVFVAFYLIILLSTQSIFGLVVLFIGIIQVAILIFTFQKVNLLNQQSLVAQVDAQSFLIEALRGMTLIKATAAEEHIYDQWTEIFYKRLRISIRQDRLSTLINTALATIRTASPMVLLWLSSFYVLDGSISLGTMLALNALAIIFLSHLSSLVSVGQRLQLVTAHLERISDVVSTASEQKSDDKRTPYKFLGKIEIRSLSFSYSSHSPQILQDISIIIEPGQKVAIVGPTGSGKSTLAMLLLGLYSPTEGEIFFDDVPLSQLDYRILRSQLGIVPQESILFNDTIFNNITFNNPDLHVDRVVEVARYAEIHDEIESMVMGYETIIGEGGSSLSGGQRQRISMARALAHNPKLMVLDEATSHLDAVTESRIDQNLSELSCTRIVIAHRLSTIRNADQILVLKEGQIIAKGTHDELVRYGGVYLDLIRKQYSEQ